MESEEKERGTGEATKYLEDGVVSLHVGRNIGDTTIVKSLQDVKCPHCGENIADRLANGVLTMAGRDRGSKPSAGDISTDRNRCPSCEKEYTAVFQKLAANRSD